VLKIRSRYPLSRRLNGCLPRPRSGPGSGDTAEAKMPIKGTSLTRQPLSAQCGQGKEPQYASTYMVYIRYNSGKVPDF
jgi:hypothetical protein